MQMTMLQIRWCCGCSEPAMLLKMRQKCCTKPVCIIPMWIPEYFIRKRKMMGPAQAHRTWTMNMLRQCELYADFPSVKMLHTAPIEDTRNPLKTETGVRMLNGATAHRTVFHIPFQGVYSFVSLNICFAYRKWHFSKQNLLQNNNSNKNRSNNVDCLNRKTCLCLCQAKTIRASDGNEWMFAFFVIDVCVLCAPCVGLLCQRKTHAPRPTPRQCAYMCGWDTHYSISVDLISDEISIFKWVHAWMSTGSCAFFTGKCHRSSIHFQNSHSIHRLHNGLYHRDNKSRSFCVWSWRCAFN